MPQPVRIDLPNGKFLLVKSKNLIWFRDKLPAEPPHAAITVLQFGDGIVFSVESVDDLLEKFTDKTFVDKECKLVQLTPPARPDRIWVNAVQVEQVMDPDVSVHEDSKAMLRFSIEDKLGVLETTDAAETKIAAALAQGAEPALS